MKLAYISDLHLEFLAHTYQKISEQYLEDFNNLKVDKLIIAGDLHSKWKIRERFLDRIEIPYIFIEGNHDYLGKEVTDNFFDQDDICGATLWSSLYGLDKNDLSLLWDFRWIHEWTPEKCSNMFYKQRDQIFNSPSEIVVTHFAPSLQAVDPRFIGDKLNPYFCNDLDDLIRTSNKKLWIFGHTHTQGQDFMIGNCRCVSNPIGYPNEFKNVKREVKFIEV
jgi:Icc-related predicted phosphoesterase